MEDEKLNLEVRQFLKRFGIAAQRAMESSIREAVRTGAVAADATLPVSATLAIPGVLPDLRVDGEIELG